MPALNVYKPKRIVIFFILFFLFYLFIFFFFLSFFLWGGGVTKFNISVKQEEKKMFQFSSSDITECTYLDQSQIASVIST